MRLRILFLTLQPIFATTLAAATLTVSLSGGKSITNRHGQADLYSVTLELTREWPARTELGLYVAPQTVWQPRSWFGYEYGNGNERVNAIGAGAVVRHFFGPLFVELSAGPLWSEKQVPAATSQLNFVTQPGAGVILAGKSRVPVIVAYRFAHISNGGLSSRNPGWNVSTVMVGVRLKRR